MANIKSAQKRIKITETKTLRNRVIKSALKTSIKKFELSLNSDNAEETKNSYLSVVKALDMAASKGVIHKNMAARKKSRLNARMNKISA